MPRILLADDHPLFRQALSAVLTWSNPGFEIEEAGTLESAFNLLSKRSDITLVLLDLKMPDSPGFGGLLTLKSKYPLVPIIVVSAISDAETIDRAIEFGASGFIAKSATHNEIASAIKSVLAGDVWAPEVTLKKNTSLASPIASLTPGQLRILAGLQKGLSNKLIAAGMGISVATVKVHMADMFKKLGVMNRTQAAIAAKTLNLPADPEQTDPAPKKQQ
jgi:DNA-binding NarL/FixJ family response regulator